MRTLIVAVCLVVLAAAVIFVVSRRMSPEGRRDRMLRSLNETGTVVRRSCGLGEAHVDGARWQQLGSERQQEAAAAIASWCAEQGGQATLNVIDSNTRTTLARWNGSSLEPQR
jgi:hypothetical protein